MPLAGALLHSDLLIPNPIARLELSSLHPVRPPDSALMGVRKIMAGGTTKPVAFVIDRVPEDSP